MRFSFGENWDAEKKRLENWHDFYPLWPTCVFVKDGKNIYAWLEMIEEKCERECNYDGCWWSCEYRPKSEKREPQSEVK